MSERPAMRSRSALTTVAANVSAAPAGRPNSASSPATRRWRLASSSRRISCMRLQPRDGRSIDAVLDGVETKGSPALGARLSVVSGGQGLVPTGRSAKPANQRQCSILELVSVPQIVLATVSVASLHFLQQRRYRAVSDD
jgi:hypothetical protein